MRNHSQDRADVERVFRTYLRALEAADIALAAEVWLQTPDVLVVTPIGRFQGWDGVKKIWARTQEEFSERKVQASNVSIVVARDAAWLVFDFVFTATLTDGKPLLLKGWESHGYREPPTVGVLPISTIQFRRPPKLRAAMIVIEKNNGATDAVIWSEAPMIYMDNWALNLFATDTGLHRQFLDLFQDRGTLLISVMLAVEIGANAAPERPALRAFLDAVGPHWIPLTIDPFAVIGAQEGNRDEDGACISRAFVKDPNFSARLRVGNLSLASVIDITRGADGVALKAATDESTARMTADIAHHRAAYQQEPAYLDRMWPALPWDAARYMRPIYNAFLRLTVRGAFVFNDNHARDMFHSIASAGCAQMTLLDSHWAEQVRQVQRQLGRPDGFVRVYSPADVPHFLADLAAHPRSRGEDRPAV